MKLRPFALPIAALTLAALAACGSGSNTAGGGGGFPGIGDASSAPSADSSSDALPSDVSNDASSDVPSAEPSEEPGDAGTPGDGASDDTGTSAGGSATTINKTLTDPVMGNKAVIEQAVVDFTMPAATVKKWAGLQGKQVVLVKAKMTAGTKYYETFGGDDLWITNTKNGIDVPATDDIADYTKAVKAAGYSPIIGDADEGASTEGWAIFVIDPQPHVTLSLRRLAARTSGGKTIPAKDFSIKLD